MKTCEDEHFEPGHTELDRLRDELHQLERRVDSLEHRNGSQTELAAPMPAGPDAAGSGFAPPNAIPVAGRAILGLAGAYLLRAISEAGALPHLLVVAAAILYAAAWLVFSIRIHQKDAFAGATYGITAALILAPLLWEATVRFNVLPPPATAVILVAFAVLGSALAWPGNPGAGSAVVTLSTVVTALALMPWTGILVPFAAALLAIACVIEAGACRGRGLNLRVPVAIAADLAVWLLLYITTGPGGVPQSYKPVGPATSLALCALLFLIYAVSIGWRTVAQRRAITGFEMGQSAVAFTLAAGGAWQITQGRAAVFIGVLSAVAGAACYFAAFIRFAESPRRNHYVFAAWGAALALAASFLIMPEALLTPIWSAAAVAATLAGARASKPALSIQGTLYLLAAGLISGLPGSILNAFTGSTLDPATPALWIIAISAAGCYAACCYAGSRRTPARASLVSALLAGISIGALLILAALPLVAGKPTASLLAAARTLVICALALAFGLTGSRTGRRELVWISYGAIALGTVKLFLEDFHQSYTALAVSLVCYGALLMLAPKPGGKSSPATR